MANAGARILAADTARWYCKGAQTTAQSLTSGTQTAITFNGTDDVDNLNIHDPVTNNSRFVIGLALGWWLVSGIVWFSTGATATRRGASIALNGTLVPGATNIGWAANATAAGSAPVPGVAIQATAAADYVELMAYQDSGVAINTGVGSPFRSSITCVYLGT